MPFCQTFLTGGREHVVLYHHCRLVLFVGVALGTVQHQVLQFLPGLAQTGRRGVILDVPVLQVVHPLLQGRGGHVVKLVDAHDVVFGENLAGGLHADGAVLLDVNLQRVVGVYADERAGAVIEVVAALAQIEVDNADGVHLLDLLERAAQLDVLRDGLGRAVENALQIVELARQLYLDDEYLATVVLGFDVYTVELVVGSVLIALALQQLHNVDGLAQQDGHQTLKHAEVGLVAKHAFHGPVESYIFVVCVHSVVVCTSNAAKVQLFFVTAKKNGRNEP